MPEIVPAESPPNPTRGGSGTALPRVVVGVKKVAVVAVDEVGELGY